MRVDARVGLFGKTAIAATPEKCDADRIITRAPWSRYGGGRAVILRIRGEVCHDCACNPSNDIAHLNNGQIHRHHQTADQQAQDNNDQRFGETGQSGDTFIDLTVM